MNPIEPGGKALRLIAQIGVTCQPHCVRCFFVFRIFFVIHQMTFGISLKKLINLPLNEMSIFLKSTLQFADCLESEHSMRLTSIVSNVTLTMSSWMFTEHFYNVQ